MAAPAQSKRITIISAFSLHSPPVTKTKSKNEENHQNSPFLPKFCGLHRGSECSERHNTIATSSVDLPLAPKISARYPAYLSCWSQNLFFSLERLPKLPAIETNSFSFIWSRRFKYVHGFDIIVVAARLVGGDVNAVGRMSHVHPWRAART